MATMSKTLSPATVNRPGLQPLRSAKHWLIGYWRKRRSAKALEALSDDQLRDCGLREHLTPVQIIEVRRELMRDLMFCR